MNDKTKKPANFARKSEDILQKIGQYSCSANNRTIMHDMNNLITSLVLHLSMCESALQAGDSQKVSVRLNKMDRMISNLEAFAKDLPKRIQITPQPTEIRLADIIAEAQEFIATVPGLQGCQFVLNLETDDTVYTVDLHFIEVLLIAITRQAVLQFHNPLVTISNALDRKLKTCDLSVEVLGESIPAIKEAPAADFMFDNIPLHSLCRIASKLHPALNLQYSRPPQLAFTCQLQEEPPQPMR